MFSATAIRAEAAWIGAASRLREACGLRIWRFLRERRHELVEAARAAGVETLSPKMLYGWA